MIVIIGETHDDILYFDSVLANKREETILGKYKISVGTIFSQDAIVASDLFTSSLSSAVLMHILDKYYVDLIISVGRCMYVGDNIKNGDIIGYILKGLERRIAITQHTATFLSSNNMSSQMVEVLNERKEIFSLKNELFVIDQNSAGVALASKLKDTPFIVVKVAENNLSAVDNLESYSAVLSKYIDLGKAVISTINDISRSDILEGN